MCIERQESHGDSTWLKYGFKLALYRLKAAVTPRRIDAAPLSHPEAVMNAPGGGTCFNKCCVGSNVTRQRMCKPLSLNNFHCCTHLSLQASLPPSSPSSPSLSCLLSFWLPWSPSAARPTSLTHRHYNTCGSSCSVKVPSDMRHEAWLPLLHSRRATKKLFVR